MANYQISQTSSSFPTFYDVVGSNGQRYIYVPKEYVSRGFVENGTQHYSDAFLNPNVFTNAQLITLPDDTGLTEKAKKSYSNPREGYLWKTDDLMNIVGVKSPIGDMRIPMYSYVISSSRPAIQGMSQDGGTTAYSTGATATSDRSFLYKGGVRQEYTDAKSSGGGDFFSNLFGGNIGAAFASIDPSASISRAATNLFQPFEKAVSTGLADVDKNLSLSKNAPVIAAVALTVVVPVIGEEVGASLMKAGYLTSAANAANAVLAAGGTAAQAAAAAASATATATAVGTAIASATAQVAQGVPVGDAIRNATVAATVQLNAPGAAKTVNDIVGNPAVTNLVVSTAASVVQTAATGGNEADIIRNAKGALVGSGVTSATDSNIAGRAVGGGVTGGVAGALVGAAGAIGSDFKKTGDTTKTASDTSGDVLLAAGPGFTMGGASGADQYGITPEQKQGIAGYLAASVPTPNSGVDIDNEGAYVVRDPSNSRVLKFSADGSFLGGAFYVDTSDEPTTQIVKDFLSAPAIQQIPESNKTGFASTSQSTTTGVGASGVTGTGVSGDAGAGTAGGEGVTPAPLSQEVEDKITQLGGILGLGTPSSNPEGYTALKGGASGGGQSRMGILAIDKDQQQQAIIFLENLPITKPEDKKAIQNLKTAVAQTPTVTKQTPVTGSVAAPKTFTPATFTPAVPPTAPGRGVETDEERIARLDAQTARVIAQEADYTTRSRPRTTEQAVIDLTGIGGANVGGNVVVGPGADTGAGNATGNVVVADAGGGNAAGNVVISDGGLGGGGGNAAGNVVVGPGAGEGGNAAGNVIVGPGDGGGGPGGNVTIDAGGGGGNATSNVSGNVVVDEPPVEEVAPPAEEEKPPEEDEKPPEEEDKPPGEKEEPYKPDLFIYGGVTPKAKPRTRTNLGTTLQPPFAPSTTLGQALTGYRGAGEIEGKKTGKPRRDVWNEESLRLKDALGL